MPQRRASLPMISRTWAGVGCAHGRNLRCTTFLRGARLSSILTIEALAVGVGAGGFATGAGEAAASANARGAIVKAIGMSATRAATAGMANACFRRISMLKPPVGGRAHASGQESGDYRHTRRVISTRYCAQGAIGRRHV